MFVTTAQPGPPRVVNANRIMKVSYPNRRLFMRLALVASIAGTLLLSTATFSNDWVYTSERILYQISQEPPGNATTNDQLDSDNEINFKNASFGPWLVCFEELRVSYACHTVNLFSELDPGDTTSSLEISLRKATFMLLGNCLLTFCSTVVVFASNCKRNQNYVLVLSCGVGHICAGLGALLTLVVYISSFTQEVGKKLYPQSPMEDPLFHYRYGRSFYCAVASFVCVELAAVLSLSVYMAKHDEDMANRYHIRNLFKKMTDLLSTMTRPRYAGPNRRFRRTSSVVKDSSRTSSLALNHSSVSDDPNRMEITPAITLSAIAAEDLRPFHSNIFAVVNVQTKV